MTDTKSIETLFKESETLIANNHYYAVRGIPFKIPFGAFMQKLISNPALVEKTADIIIGAINTKIVAAHDYDGLVIASEVCRKTGKELLYLQRNTTTGKISGIKPPKDPSEKILAGKEVTIITGVLATGTYSNDAIELLDQNGGKCAKIISIFDYGFNLYPHVFKEPNSFEEIKRVPIEVHSLMTLESFIVDCGQENVKELGDWFTSQGNNIFRKVNMINRNSNESPAAAESSN